VGVLVAALVVGVHAEVPDVDAELVEREIDFEVADPECVSCPWFVPIPSLVALRSGIPLTFRLNGFDRKREFLPLPSRSKSLKLKG